MPQAASWCSTSIPKDMTPGCTLEGQDFRDLHAGLQAREDHGASACRRTAASATRSSAPRRNFPFELLSDEDEKVCQLFDVIREKSLYGRKFMGIERSTFLIDAGGQAARASGARSRSRATPPKCLRRRRSL